TEFPQSGNEAELAESVEDALLREARAFETTIAYLRTGFLGIVAIFNVVIIILLQEGQTNGLLFVSAAWFIAAAGFAFVLRRGWYHPRVRRFVPLVDAIIIVSVFGLVYNNMQAVWARAPVGMVALTAAACAFLAFSGALRLSPTSGPLATVLACIAWGVIGLLVDLPLMETIFIGATILTTGIMGARLTRVFRRVIMNEVTRIRLAVLYNDARQAVSAREDVLKIVSHDLRNPLNTIAMTADLIRDVAVPEQDRKRYLDMILRSGRRMNRMIQDLLDVARLERGQLFIEPVSTPLATIVNDALDMMAPMALERGVALDAELAADLPPVMADPERIVQLFSNLVGNALKFTPKDGAVCIRAQLSTDQVRVTVSDTGPGIPANEIDNVFASFWQAKKADRRGIGLGLTIARAIVEAHGGTIGVASAPGKGAEFWFTLNVAR
ncbi:MAG TPA: HAMP domain-containing sensor histidine kinase, partial [Longimicrobiales bacterium]